MGHPLQGKSLAPAALAAAAALLVCLALIHAMPGDAYWAGDCASRALQAGRLLATHYSDFHLDYPAAEFDPDGLAYPLPALAVRLPGGFASIFPIGYAALAAPGLALGGPAALRWPAALGLAGCVFGFALWLAPVVDRRVAALAALALGLATPLLFYGVVVWEHSLAVALCVAAWLLAASGTPARLACAGALLGLGCWLREELVLVAAGLALACALLQRRAAGPALLAAGALPPLLLLAAWNRRAYGDVLGPHVIALDAARALALPVSALPRRVAALLAAYGTSEPEALALAGAGLAGVAIGAAAEWRGRRVAALASASAIGLAIWLYAEVRAHSLAPLLGLVSYNGWIAQLPASCLAGCGAVRLGRHPAGAGLRAGVLAGLFFLFAASAIALATQSVFGTGLHVGPRLLLPGLPALWALALLAVHGDGPGAARRVAATSAALLVAAGVVSSSRGVRLLALQASEVDALQRTLRARPERVVVSGDAMLTELLAGVWHEKAMLHAQSPATLARVAAALRRRGETAFLVLAPEATPIGDPAVGARCRLAARQRGAALGYVDTDLLRCTLGAAEAAPR
jgi:hypothetical protein